VVCNKGERGWTTIRLANVGCCTMRYSWRHHPHLDHFTTGRYRTSPFIFNAASGILLPEERVIIIIIITIIIIIIIIIIIHHHHHHHHHIM
jgi:hypothetical protein